jgi:tRNA (guanine37-N1)-methyltransferase
MRYVACRLFQGHEREYIVSLLHRHDLVFDVFAGVGPFVVPASMLGCTIYANDMNPESVRWMSINLKTNQLKRSSKNCQLYNLDGREFLRTIVFPRIELYQQELIIDKDKQWCLSDSKIVILMNLPELAWTFLDVLPSWLTNNINDKQQWIMPVHIYCYTFSKDDNHDQEIRQRLKTIVPNLLDEQISWRFVRRVAPRKDMLCIEIRLFSIT